MNRRPKAAASLLIAYVVTAVDTMFARIGRDTGPRGIMSASGGQIIALREEAKRLLLDTSGLQLPSDLLHYAKTLSYLFSLGDTLDPNVDLMKLSLPYLLRFLAAKD